MSTSNRRLTIALSGQDTAEENSPHTEACTNLSYCAMLLRKSASWKRSRHHKRSFVAEYRGLHIKCSEHSPPIVSLVCFAHEKRDQLCFARTLALRRLLDEAAWWHV